MLKIVDYAKRKKIEWYEVFRHAINESSVAPVAILTQGEVSVFELDEDGLIGNYPDAEPIPLAFVECTLSPALMAKLIYARFPIIVRPVPKNMDGFVGNFYQLEDMPIRPPDVCKYEGLEKVWFGFSKQFSITLSNIWIPDDYQFNSQDKSKQESEEIAVHKTQLKPHTKFIEHQIRHGKSRLNSWQFFKRLASESRGREIVELPGFGPIYLKQSPQDIVNSILYSETVFKTPADGKTVKKNSFDRAWRRISGHK
jgi:hypothetical protein